MVWILFPTPSTFNMDGEITDLDLLQFLGAFGNANNCDPTIPPLYDIRNNTVGRPI